MYSILSDANFAARPTWPRSTTCYSTFSYLGRNLGGVASKGDCLPRAVRLRTRIRLLQGRRQRNSRRNPPSTRAPATSVDRMLERAREVTRNGKYSYIEYARFADDLVILIDAYKRHDWLIGAVERRLREEIGKLQVEINDEKSRIVDLERGESFGFLGFDFRYLRSRRGAWRPHYTPKLKKRTALMRELKAVFRRYRSQPIERVMNLINPVLRGWVNYFAVGHSSECFSFIKDWVEKKVRRHLAHAQKRKGFGWERWSRRWLYDTLGLFNGYRVRRDRPKVLERDPALAKSTSISEPRGPTSSWRPALRL
jgi:hypothetical protein